MNKNLEAGCLKPSPAEPMSIKRRPRKKQKLEEERIIYHPGPRTVDQLISALAGYSGLPLGSPNGKATKVKVCRKKDSPYFIRIEH